ncbi:Leucine-rich repeat typical subtype [Arabidopsis suecica]|uniref:Receptor like protein n=1 Tax=Arabidopsis suecica TaxID=45249 RepID=A0A8T2CI01_ARASU|nr:Leucine-rich repeat typical subtype [Arabidopsis suecica]
MMVRCHCYFFCLIFVLLHTLASSTLNHCRNDQRDALLEFKDEFASLLELSSWNKSSDCCSWVEVTCDAKSGKVILLELPSTSLNSSLKPNSSLFKLQHLTKLSLYNCSLYGEIPSSLGYLSRLTILDLSYNALVGQIPASIGNLSLISFLDLSNNRLVGQVPTSIEKLFHLEWLVLSNNQLVGKVLASLGNLTQLYYLGLGNNNFSGNIPVSFSNLTKLKEVYLNNNYFESMLPLNMSGFQELSYFDVGENSFFGPFPSSLFTLPLLMKVFMGRNNFTGPIDFGNISSSSNPGLVLYLDHNKFTGQVPESISKFLDIDFSYNSFSSFGKSSEVLEETQIAQLDLSSNSFRGPLPQWICKLRSLDFLDLSNNSFSGSIPQCLRNLTVSLNQLLLSNNNFSGTLPDMFVNATNLKVLDVSRNQLEGKLPKSLISCNHLQFLNVQMNIIKDTFPFWLGSLPSLNVLILRSNQFYGPVYQPHLSAGFQNLRVIDISHNGFSGSLPPSYFSYWHNMARIVEQDYDDENLGNPRYGIDYHNTMEMVHKGVYTEFERIRRDFRAIDFSGNNFFGNIPESIGLLKELRVLNLSSNAFTNNIPQSLASLTKLEALDLSRNNLSGQIPRDLGNLFFLSIMNFSHNNLEGPVPQGTQFQRQNCSSFMDNPKLYGLEEICRETHVANPIPQKSEDMLEPKEQVINWIAAAIAYGPGVFCGLVIGHIFTSHKHEWFMEKFGLNKPRRFIKSIS